MTETDKLVAAAYAASNLSWDDFLSRYQDGLARIKELRETEGRQQADNMIAALDLANRR